MKIADKLKKVEDTFSVARHDNGFVVSVRGESEPENWKTVEIVTLNTKEVLDLFLEFADLPKV